MADVTLALSGGGAAGIGHIPVLEAFDELGVRPAAIAGVSIGAVIGVGYAAGLSGAELREHVIELAERPSHTARKLWKDMDFRSLTSLFSADPRAVLEVVLPEAVPEAFEALGIPFHVTATDYYGREAKTFTSGAVRDAIAASMAIPGLFRPLALEGRVYVDGGVTNNLPLDVLPKAEISVAVDVASGPPNDGREVPGALTASVESMRIMMRALLLKTLEDHPPTVLIEPGSSKFRALEFWRVSEILDAAEHAREDTKRALAEALEGAEGDTPRAGE